MSKNLTGIIVQKLIGEHDVDALIGPSTTPNAFAIPGIIPEAEVPVFGP